MSDCEAHVIEACILRGDVNKYHTGILGHSDVCPWVKLTQS
jgi:ribosome modulation factor